MKIIDIGKYPSVVATEKENYGLTTNKYQFVPTTQVVDILADHKWFPVEVKETRVIKSERAGFQRHMLRFRQEGAPSLSDLNKTYAEIILENAHDGSSMFRMMAGVFVKVCGNGLIVAERLYPTYKIKHIGFTANRVKDAIRSIIAVTPKIGNQIDLYSNLKLSRNEQHSYVNAALYTKFDEHFLKTHHINSSSLFETVRPEEREASLWNTFNIVQEKVIEGGIRYHRRDEYGEYDPSRFRKSRKVTSISENIRQNKALWALTEHVALLKSVN